MTNKKNEVFTWQCGKDLMSVDEPAVMDGGKFLPQIRGVRPLLSRNYEVTAEDLEAPAVWWCSCLLKSLALTGFFFLPERGSIEDSRPSLTTVYLSRTILDYAAPVLYADFPEAQGRFFVSARYGHTTKPIFLKLKEDFLYGFFGMCDWYPENSDDCSGLRPRRMRRHQLTGGLRQRQSCDTFVTEKVTH